MKRARYVYLALAIVPAIALAWSSERPFPDQVEGASTCEGVYAILLKGDAIYIGRSNNVYTRLRKHAAGNGSACVASQIPGGNMSYKVLCGNSSEQMEAQLIEANKPPCNMRGERDPGRD